MTQTVEMERLAAPPCAPMLHSSEPKRRTGGLYGWLTPYLADIARCNPSIAARVLTLPRDEAHFIALALSFMGEARDDPARLEAFARDLGVLCRETILRAHAPQADPRLARFSGKLAGRPWRARTYQRLAALCAETKARKTLAHMRAVTRRAVLTLARLPADYRSPGVLRLLKHPSHLAQILFAIEIVRRVRTDLTDRQILASLERANPWSIRDWVEAHYRRLPFPTPPVGILTDGRGAVLSPICSGDELRRSAMQYENCVGDYLLRAHQGSLVFYRCEIDGKRVAMAVLRQTPGLGWAVWRIEGVANAALSGECRLRIVEMFASAGISAAPQAISDLRGFDLGY